MSLCEKCWNDAYFQTIGTSQSHYARYRRLLRERRDKPCTPEQQSGEYLKQPETKSGRKWTKSYFKRWYIGRMRSYKA